MALSLAVVTSTYHDDYETPEQSQQRAEDEREQSVIDGRWRGIMDTVGGRACVWPLLKQSYQFQPIASLDPLQMMQSVAVRDFVLPILNRLRRVCPDLLALAEREQQ